MNIPTWSEKSDNPSAGSLPTTDLYGGLASQSTDIIYDDNGQRCVVKMSSVEVDAEVKEDDNEMDRGITEGNTDGKEEINFPSTMDDAIQIGMKPLSYEPDSMQAQWSKDVELSGTRKLEFNVSLGALTHAYSNVSMKAMRTTPSVTLDEQEGEIEPRDNQKRHRLVVDALDQKVFGMRDDSDNANDDDSSTIVDYVVTIT